MRLIFASEGGETWAVDVSGDMTLIDTKALLEAETGVAAADLHILTNGQELVGDSQSLQHFGVKEDDVLLLRSARSGRVQLGAQTGGPSSGADDAENARRQILANPQLLQRLREMHPELADAAQHNPPRFRELLPELTRMGQAAQAERQRKERLLMADPFDIAAQKEIEEAIRREAVVENLEHAMEYSPESFGRVIMLYVNVEINGHPIKAFVDSGAQATIMSPSCAEACNLTRLIDDRWAGVARGVGTARILGRVHSAQIKVGSMFLSCSLDILEGRDVDLLFGLDMLRRHQACIDLRKNALVIQNEDIPFLAEHDIPKSNFHEVQEDASGNVTAPPNLAAATGAAAAANSARAAASASGSDATAPTKFPGSGNVLSGASAEASAPPPPATSSSRASHSENAIANLVALGVGRDQAIKLLDATGGDPERAASLLFSSFE